MRIALDTDREARDNRIDDLVASYYVSSAEREDDVNRLAAADAARADSVASLREEGESDARIAALCELAEADVRRLRKLAKDGDDVAAETAPDAEHDTEQSADAA
jgi:hypothetical protein